MTESIAHERYRHVLRLRREGLTFRDIAGAIGVSHSRACQLHERALVVEARMNRWQVEDPTLETPIASLRLSDRTYRALVGSGYCTLADAIPLDEEKCRDLLRLPNFSRSCLKEVQTLIESL